MLAARYELRRPLGQGGMAEVHEAVAHGAHGFVRRVAVKRLRADVATDPSFVRMFLDEARIASRLHHAGIVSVLDYGVVDGAPFQVIELVDGWDMAAILRRAIARGQRVPVDVALYVVTEVAHALAHAHEATDERGVPLGIVHRDVKPSNILLSKAGEVKLGDFGIAIARERASRTTGNVARGTPSYMAPEQLLGGVIDARADLFALGCSLHALLTGQSPMGDPTARIAILSGEQWLLPTLESDVDAIVARATRLAPEERPASAREMARDLGAALAQRLRTDVKTRMTEWLASLGSEPRPPTTPPAPTITVMSTVGDRLFVTETSAPTMTTAGSGAAGDRVFVAAPLAATPPTTIATSSPHVSEPPAAPSTKGAASSAQGRIFGVQGAMASPRSGPPPAALAAAPGAHPSPRRPPTPTASRKRTTPFMWGLGAALAFGITAIVGAIAGPRLLRAIAPPDDAPAPVPAPPATIPSDAPSQADAPAPDDAGDDETMATAAATVTATATATATASAEGGARLAAGLGPPVKGGCRCDAMTTPVGTKWPLRESLCHPMRVHNPSCKCEPDQFKLCWVPFAPTPDRDEPCPERWRTFPASALDGEACTGYLVETTQHDGGPADVAKTSAAGRLVCHRCDDTRDFPRTQGASCVGISNRTGKRVVGRIECAYTER